MAFREVRVFEVREVLRLWLAGEGIRATERLVGFDRKTVRRYVDAAVGFGLVRGGGEGQLSDVFIGMVVEAVRPHRTDGHGEAWRLLQVNHEVIAVWVELPRFDGHLMMASSGAKGVRCEYERPAEVHSGVQGGGRGHGRGLWWQIAKVARELKLHDSSLGNWVREARAEAAGAPTAQERAELRELRAELERVTRRSATSWQKQSPTSRRRTRRACDHRVHVHRRGAGRSCVWSGPSVRCAGCWPSPAPGSTTGLSRPPSDHELTDRQLAIEIEAIWECSARTYGAPRVHAWLLRQGFNPSRKRVARIMREQGFEGESGRRKVRTPIVDRCAGRPRIESGGTSTRPLRT